MSTAIKPPSNASLISRVAFTPISQLLRGRIAPIPTVESVIAAASLPPPISELINRVVVKTRLWKREQLEVVRELISHFNEGREFGTPVEELVKDFGQPAIVAKLIRRSKKRNRSLIYRSTVRASQIFGLFVLVLVFAYGFFAFRTFCYSPTLNMNYVADYNASIMAFPEQERAWPLYREAALRQGRWPSGIPSDVNPNSADWQILSQYATAHLEAVQLFRQAASQPYLGSFLTDEVNVDIFNLFKDEKSMPLPQRKKSQNPSLFSIYMPEHNVLRSGHRLLQIDAYLAKQLGDANRFMADIEAIMNIVDHYSDKPFVINDVGAFELILSSCDVLNRVLRDNPNLLGNAGWIAISHRLAVIRGGGALHIHLEGERLGFQDFLQRIYTDDGDGDGHLTRGEVFLFDTDGVSLRSWYLNCCEEAWALPLVTCLDVGRRENSRRHEEIISLIEQESRLPLWQRSVSKADQTIIRSNSNLFDRFRHLPVDLCMPSLKSVIFRAEFTTQRRDATLTAIALEMYKRKNGTYPESLAALVPQFLPATLPDRFDGRPMKYKLVDGKPLLYSIGSDRCDNGGHLPSGDVVKANQMTSRWCLPGDVPSYLVNKYIGKGDWILWPPVD